MCAPEAVASALIQLDAFLFTASLDTPIWLSLRDARLAREIFRQALVEFVRIYRRIYTSVAAEAVYEDLWRSGVALRTAEELEVLLLLD